MKNKYLKPRIKVKKIKLNFSLQRRNILDSMNMLLQYNTDDELYALRSHNYSPSDKRLKKNIKPLTNVLEKLIKLKVVTFKWKKNIKKQHFLFPQIGIIAQELEHIFPSLVKNDKYGYKTIDYAQLCVILIGAIQELEKINKSIQKRIFTLEKMVVSKMM